MKLSMALLHRSFSTCGGLGTGGHGGSKEAGRHPSHEAKRNLQPSCNSDAMLFGLFIGKIRRLLCWQISIHPS